MLLPQKCYSRFSQPPLVERGRLTLVYFPQLIFCFVFLFFRYSAKMPPAFDGSSYARAQKRSVSREKVKFSRAEANWWGICVKKNGKAPRPNQPKPMNTFLFDLFLFWLVILSSIERMPTIHIQHKLLK